MKKGIRGLVCIIVFLLAIIIGNSSFAMSTNSSNYIMLYNRSTKRESGYYYVSNKAVKLDSIYKLAKTNKKGNVHIDNGNNELLYSLNNKNYNNLSKPVNYNQVFDLKNREEIEKDKVYSKHIIKDERTYNKLIWVLDNICIPEDEDSRLKFFNTIGIKESEFLLNNISVEKMYDIIDSIQQAAIWNYCELDNEININSEFGYSTEMNTVFKAVDEFYPDSNNDNPIIKIYNYLVRGAEEAVNNGYKYNTKQNISAVSFDKSRAKTFTFNDSYYIGPYNFNVDTNANYSLSLKIYNNANEIGNAKIVYEDGVTDVDGLSTSEKIMNSRGRDFYIVIPTNSSAYNVSVSINADTEVTYIKYLAPSPNLINSYDPIVQIKKDVIRYNESDSKIINKPEFDLSLSSFVSGINNETFKTREPTIVRAELEKLSSNQASLDNGTTASKKIDREKFVVEAGNRVTYTVRVYNEGDIDGTAKEIVAYIPNGVEFIPQSESEVNATYNWNTDVTKRVAVCSYLADKNISKYDKLNNKISYEDIKFECRIVGTTTSDDQYLKTVFEITANSQNNNDRDSNVGNVKNKIDSYNPGTLSQARGYEDDDDCDVVFIKGKFFDLSLREFISKVNGAEIRNDKGLEREPKVNVEPLKNGNETAEYNHSKKPYSVEANDTVTYTIRVYNEGQMDGYATEITAHLPEELELINNEFNANNGWIIDSQDKTQRTVRTKKLSQEQDDDNIIKAFNFETGEISYKQVELLCRIKANADTQKEITNIVEITKSDNVTGLIDRDNKMTAKIPSDEDMHQYRADIEQFTALDNNDYYYKGQEDDDDFVKIIIDKFDLALRMYAYKINEQYTEGRVPIVNKSEFGTVKDNRLITTMNYNHNKETISVCNNDEVTFVIRVYNEGTKAGYANLIRDIVPEGFVYLADNDVNKEFKWVMKDNNGNVTDDVQKVATVETNYLSKDQEQSEGSNLIDLFDSANMNEPKYKEIQLVLKIKEPNSESREVINRAEVLQDKDNSNADINDSDSTPGIWNDYEDDQDIEKFYVKKLDFAIKTWLKSMIIIENGISKEMNTKQNENTEQKQNVELKINDENSDNTVVKYKYAIRIYNEGEIAGYIKEIIDYIPKGLSFNLADNINWERSGDNAVCSYIKDKKIEPGSFADLEIILTWDLDQKETSLINNQIEISKVYDASYSKDIDSTEANKDKNEDDIDYANSKVSITKIESKKFIIYIAGGILILLILIVIIRKIVIKQ